MKPLAGGVAPTPLATLILSIGISPDELYSAGYRDGMALKAKHRQFRVNLDYLKGYVAGYRDHPGSLFHLPAVAESSLERGWGDELLNPC